MYVQKYCIFCFTHIAYRGSLGLRMEIHRAQNTAHASIKSRFARTRPVSYSGNAKNYRAVIIISPA